MLAPTLTHHNTDRTTHLLGIFDIISYAAFLNFIIGLDRHVQERVCTVYISKSLKHSSAHVRSYWHEQKGWSRLVFKPPSHLLICQFVSHEHILGRVALTSNMMLCFVVLAQITAKLAIEPVAPKGSLLVALLRI